MLTEFTLSAKISQHFTGWPPRECQQVIALFCCLTLLTDRSNVRNPQNGLRLLGPEMQSKKGTNKGKSHRRFLNISKQGAHMEGRSWSPEGCVCVGVYKGSFSLLILQ